MATQDTTAKVTSAGGIKKFLREVKGELKKVTWPTRQQLIAYTGVVLVAVIIASALIGLFDGIFSYLFRLFLKG